MFQKHWRKLLLGLAALALLWFVGLFTGLFLAYVGCLIYPRTRPAAWRVLKAAGKRFANNAYRRRNQDDEIESTPAPFDDGWYHPGDEYRCTDWWTRIGAPLPSDDFTRPNFGHDDHRHGL